MGAATRVHVLLAVPPISGHRGQAAAHSAQNPSMQTLFTADAISQGGRVETLPTPDKLPELTSGRGRSTNCVIP